MPPADTASSASLRAITDWKRKATGFSKTVVALTLTTEQTLAVPVTLSVASANVTVSVTGAPPIIDTAETRNEMTLEQSSVDTLPWPAAT